MTRTTRTTRTIIALLAVVCLAACEEPAQPKPAATLDALAAQFQAARKAGDEAKATALAYSLVPSKAELATFVTKSEAADAWVAAFKFVDLPLADPAVKSLGQAIFEPGDPKRTVTQVHAATTEELVAYAKGTVAFEEFPGGMPRFAAIAAPGRTWYVVEHVEPGSSTGMKFTCFTKVGDRFVFLPKPWGALPK